VEQQWFHIGDAEITFDSPMAFLYEAIMPIILDTVIEILNVQLSDSIIGQFVEIGDKSLQDDLRVFQNETTDQRFISLTVDSDFLRAGFGGQMLYMDPETDVITGYITTPPEPLPDVVTNYAIQYYISSVSFQSMLNLVQNWYIDDEMRAMLSGPIEVRRIVHTGIEIVIPFAEFGDIGYHAFVNPSVYASQIDLNMTRVQLVVDVPLTTVSDPAASERIRTFVDKLNSILNDYSLAINNANGFSDCKAIYPSPDWVLCVCRLIG